MLFASLISTYLIYKGRSRTGPFPHEWWCKTTNATSAAGPIAGLASGNGRTRVWTGPLSAA